MSNPNIDPANLPPVQNDPFPKFIIVCFAVTFVGLFVIFGILLFEFIQRGQSRQAGPAAPIVPIRTAPQGPANTP